jgi:uncharacterized FAD-dependent dehydrogenase
MQYIIDIKDGKDGFMLELLKNFSYIEVKPYSLKSKKPKAIDDLREAFQELELIKQGKAKSRDAFEVLDEL